VGYFFRGYPTSKVESGHLPEHTFMNVFEYPYQLFSKLPFCDVSIVYVLNCKQLPALAPCEADLRIDFTAEDASQLAGVANCLAGFIDNRLVGYVWYRDGLIPSEMNTPGDPFNGFDLQLSDASQYLFKVFVDENYRGLKINQYLCNALGEQLAAQGCDHLVTLTAWENTAFRKSAERVGFENIGNCIELATQGKSIYFFAKNDSSIVVRRSAAKDLY